MMNRLQRILLLLLFVSTCPFSVVAQDSTDTAPTKLKKWELKGYIKDLETISIAPGENPALLELFLHNRLNFRWYPVTGLTFVIEARTRFYNGSIVSAQPGFGTALNDNSNDIYKMSVLVINTQSTVLQTMLDRAFVDYTRGKWDVKLGRQRINWGVNLVWNPNDIFNAYSFYDFDYEERPGSDAARITYYVNNNSSLELAGKIAERKDQVVAAALYKFNQKQYDFQFLGGVAHQDLVAGWGWAGHLGGAGFKGEMSYFQPYAKPFATLGNLSGSISIDNVFKHDWYLNASVLYNSSGNLHANLAQITSTVITAKNLYPYRYSLFTQVSDPLSPLLTAGVALIYSPAGDNALFLNPSISYSIIENWDIDLLSQLFMASFNNTSYKFQGAAIYTRLKWSF